ncbi:hypothetical protein PPROV_000108400 [Pycnococcus provasolii]|uniref:Uncharacterized protein n=1 Tax=Pycnococcus provasolii TaxID=41880 RepID=A0A830HB72_9CHLO|nr:hypothetical protein PPROV_000108400 [Pycnococcus provasolii]
MAALGGADQPGLAEQIQLLREQNNLLVQQNLQLQQGRPAARVQPQPERRRFLEPPTEADLDEQRLYLIPATLTRGPNSHRLPTDVAGAQGEPHLLNLTSEYIYLHAVEKGKKHDSTVLRILLSFGRAGGLPSPAAAWAWHPVLLSPHLASTSQPTLPCRGGPNVTFGFWTQ